VVDDAQMHYMQAVVLSVRLSTALPYVLSNKCFEFEVDVMDSTHVCGFLGLFVRYVKQGTI